MVRRLRQGFLAYGSMIVPLFLVVACWIGGWLAWPGSAMPTGIPSPRPPRAVFITAEQARGALYTRPDLFGRPSAVGFVVPAREDKVPVILPRKLPRRDALTRERLREDGESRRSAPSVVAMARASGGRYRLRTVPREPLFDAPAEGVGRLAVSRSRELRRCGFSMPDVVLEKGDPPFRGAMVFSVEIDEQGRPAHVFPEGGQAFGDAGFRFIEAIRQGKATGPGVPCTGRVIIKWESR